MAPEFLKADRHGLFALAVLVDDFWTSDSRKERMQLMAEIRQQRVCFGLTPIDRRRLQWEVGKVEQAAKKRGAGTTPSTTTKGRVKSDTYGPLRAV